MLHTNPKSKWNTTIAPFLEKKTELRLDAWGVHPSAESEAALNPSSPGSRRSAHKPKTLIPVPGG